MELERLLPEEIERRSFAIIESELPHALDPRQAPVIKRVIHATADFDYADSLRFSPTALEAAQAALAAGARIVTDTNMAKAGVNRSALAALGCEAVCLMAEAETAALAGRLQTTRAAASMELAAGLPGPLIFAIGNAPTALLHLLGLMREGRVSPALVIGAPVGFVNVIQSKELLMRADVPHIVAQGRKGGSNVAAAIINALLYRATRP